MSDQSKKLGFKKRRGRKPKARVVGFAQRDSIYEELSQDDDDYL